MWGSYMTVSVDEKELLKGQSDNRIRYIDLAKGIAMTLVIATHTLPFSARIDSILSGMHNPTFYFASGILFYLTIIKLRDKELSLYNVLKRKLLRIIYPFIVWIMIYSLLNIGLLYIFDVGGFSLFTVMLNAVNKLWFLPVLFVAYLFVCIACSIGVNKIVITIIWVISIFVTSLYSSAISKIIFFSFLVWLGTLCTNICFGCKMSLLLIAIYAIVCYFGYFCGGGYFSTEDSVHAGYKLFLIYGIDVIGALMMVGVASQICVCFKKKEFNFLMNVGKNSIYFYILHNIPIYCFEFIKTGNVLLKYVCFLVAVIVPYLYIRFLKNTWFNRFLFAVK